MPPFEFGSWAIFLWPSIISVLAWALAIWGMSIGDDHPSLLQKLESSATTTVEATISSDHNVDLKKSETPS